MNPEEMKKALTGHLKSIVAQQMQEMEMVRQKVFSLEQAQLNMKQRYYNVSDMLLRVKTTLSRRVDMKMILLAYATSWKLAVVLPLT